MSVGSYVNMCVSDRHISSWVSSLWVTQCASGYRILALGCNTRLQLIGVSLRLICLSWADMSLGLICVSQADTEYSIKRRTFTLVQIWLSLYFKRWSKRWLLMKVCHRNLFFFQRATFAIGTHYILVVGQEPEVASVKPSKFWSRYYREYSNCEVFLILVHVRDNLQVIK